MSAQPAQGDVNDRLPSAAPDPEPDFSVLGARALRHAAVPTLLFDLSVSEPSGRAVYMIALTVQLMIEPARRAYDEDTHSRLEGLFGAPERWAVTTRSLVWAQLDVLVPAFTGATTVPVPVLCGYDMEVAAGRYLYSLPDGEAPLALHFNGIVYYENERAACRWCSSRGRVDRLSSAGQDLQGDDRRTTIPTRDGWRCARRHWTRSSARACDARSRRWTRACASCCARPAMADAAGATARRAPVRGLRPVPVHAGSDQERDADSVRDRLRTRIRRDGLDHVRLCRSALRVARAGTCGVARRGPLPSRHWRAARRRSHRLALPLSSPGDLAAGPLRSEVARALRRRHSGRRPRVASARIRRRGVGT